MTLLDDINEALANPGTLPGSVVKLLGRCRGAEIDRRAFRDLLVALRDEPASNLSQWHMIRMTLDSEYTKEQSPCPTNP